MRLIRTPFRLIRANLGAYLAMNAIVYGLALVGMLTALLVPDLHAARAGGLEEDGTAGAVGALLSNPWLFALTILAVNVGKASLGMIVLPSMLVPFSGIAIFAWYAFDTGLVLAPVDETAARILIPHSLTLLIEFQAYALLMLGAFLLGRAWLRPRTVDAPNRRSGYVRGLRQLAWLGVPALALLVVGAIYEAIELVFIVPPLVVG